jgi:hypothetical protein
MGDNWWSNFHFFTDWTTTDTLLVVIGFALARIGYDLQKLIDAVIDIKSDGVKLRDNQ